MANVKKLEVSSHYEYCFGTAKYAEIVAPDCEDCPHPKECRAAHQKSKDVERELYAKQKKLRSVKSDLSSDKNSEFHEIMRKDGGVSPSTPVSDSANDSDRVIITTESDDWDYAFPDLASISASKSTENLYEILRCMIVHPDYLVVRRIYCAIQIELNRRHSVMPKGIQSPRFRPRRKALKKIKGKAYSKDNSFLSNDTQIIAMHWHYVTGRRDADDELANDVYSGAEFNFKSAAKFVVTRGAAEKKVEMIGLSLDEQWETGSIQTDEVRLEWENIQKVGKIVRRELKNKAKRNYNIRGNEDIWADVAVSMLIDVACQDNKSKRSPKKIAEKYQRVTGESKHRESINSILNSLDRHFPEGLL